MIKLSPNVCFKIKEARRQARLSQSTVASEVGCKQSALSMFEQGDGTKLNEEVVKKLAAKFSIDLKGDQQVAAGSLPVVRSKHSAFCPNPHCPSNHAYTVEGRDLFLPDRSASDPVGGKFCALCGEVLEVKCPNCGAPIHEGAFCSFCGDAYVSVASR